MIKNDRREFIEDTAEQPIIEQLLNYTRRGMAEELSQVIFENFEQIRLLLNERKGQTWGGIHDVARRHDLPCLQALSRVTSINLKTKDGLTPLHFAAKYEAKHEGLDTSKYGEAGDEAEVKKAWPDEPGDEVIEFLCDEGADIECRDDNGMTALHYAAARNNLRAARQLLRQGADLECMDNEFLTPIIFAVRNNHIEMVELLLRAGANVLFNDIQNNNILHHACYDGNSIVIDLLHNHITTRHGPMYTTEMLNSKNKLSQTPLHLAILSSKCSTTERCIELGADLSIRTATGATALHLAARSEDCSIAYALLNRGSDVHAVDLQNRTTIFPAVEANNYAMVHLLIEKKADVNHVDRNQMTPLLLAAKLGFTQICQLLLEHEAKIQVEDRQWRTPLMLAVENKHQEIVEIFMQGEENRDLLEYEDIHQNTPLHVAVKTGSLNITSYLIWRGANVMSKNKFEHTPLHVAAIYGRFGIVQKLLEQSPIVAYERDEDDNFAVHLAARHGFPFVLKRLLEHGHQTHERNSAGWTPLTFAAAHNQLECVKLLIEFGADVNTRDKSNMTPLFLACRGGHLDVATTLLDAGADPGIRVGQTHSQYAGWNALNIAVEEHQEACAQAILKSTNWQSALRNETVELEWYVSTPMRKMIEEMPSAAELALSRCVVKKPVPRSSVDYEIQFNFEFIDDWDAPYECVARKQKKKMSVDPAAESLLADVELKDNIEIEDNEESTKPAMSISKLWKLRLPSNRERIHPVKVILNNGREDLLNHPLVLALLAYKWARVCIVYYSHLLIYGLFLILFTAYMLLTIPPYMMYPDKEMSIHEICDHLRNSSQKAYYINTVVPKYGVMILAVANLVVEAFQLFYLRLSYFTLDNLVDVSIYSLALMTTIDTRLCMTITGMREKWQWGTGTAGVFLAWINLLLFIRKGPVSGIFVIMFVVVMKTFAKFFIVFSPFLLAFAVSFHSLLANQIAFRDFQSSMLKTFAMVIGELDTDSIMFEHLTEPGMEKQVYYLGMTHVLFVGFIALMCIVMMNLLVGLAVDDIKGVQRKAAFKRQEMKINMLLSTESLLLRCKRYLGTPNIYVYRPHNPSGIMDRLFDTFYRQSTKTVREIAEVQIDEDEIDPQPTKKSPEKRMEEVQSQLLQIAKILNKLVDRVNTGQARDDRSSDMASNAAKPRSRTARAAEPAMMAAASLPPAAPQIDRLMVDEDMDSEPVHF